MYRLGSCALPTRTMLVVQKVFGLRIDVFLLDNCLVNFVNAIYSTGHHRHLLLLALGVCWLPAGLKN